MMRTPVREVMSRGVIAASPEDPLAEVLQLMRKHAISCVPIVEDGASVGMFTERCFVRHLADNGSTFSDRPVREVMSSPVCSIQDDSVLFEAFHVLEQNNIRHLLVLNEEQAPAGVLTLSSIIDRVGNELMLEFQPVESIMSRLVYTVQEDKPLKDVLTEMSRHAISCVVYTADDEPRAILTERDIVAVALEGGDLSRRMLFEVMHSPVICANNKDCVHEVASLMRQHRTRRLVVVDAKGKVAGLVTQTNIVQGLESSYIRALREVIDEKDCSLKTSRRQCDELTMVLESILRSSLDMGIVATDKDLCVVYFNDLAAELLGYESQEVVGRKVSELHELDGASPKHLERILRDVNRGKQHTFTYQRMVEGDPRYHKARVARIRGGDGELLGYVHMIRDITEEKRAEENIRFMAYHDMLTGLPNRVSLDERFNLELSRAERKQHRLGVMVVDLNHFKRVNDTLGHYAGDMLLQSLAERLKSCLRKSDTVARIGGDEFALLLPEIRDKEDARTVAEKITEAMEQPFELKDEDVVGTLSIGICLYPEHAVKAKRLLEMADDAMYQAKRIAHEEGRTHYVFAEPDPTP